MSSPKQSTSRSAALVRKQFLLTQEQSSRLKAHAAASGATETEIVRAGIDMALAQARQDGDAWKTIWSKAAGLWSERSDLDAFYEERRRRRAERRAGSKS